MISLFYFQERFNTEFKKKCRCCLSIVSQSSTSEKTLDTSLSSRYGWLTARNSPRRRILKRQNNRRSAIEQFPVSDEAYVWNRSFLLLKAALHGAVLSLWSQMSSKFLSSFKKRVINFTLYQRLYWCCDLRCLKI